MNFKKLIGGLCLLVGPSFVMAENIGFGILTGVKVYDTAAPAVNSNTPVAKEIKIYFHSSAEYRSVLCEGVAVITPSKHEPDAMQQMVSIALAAYMSGKKLRAYSYTAGSCEADIISVSDTYF